ncbi:acetate--CoA ligase [Candidatus Marinamargulisbacteria bacterium SCGC AG-343-K17]|nr:acetate--CoA ligase [Candidatus Marinamargulisbacteria bacterium SCGC AG-343-K17]
MINETLTFDVKALAQTKELKDKRFSKIQTLYQKASENRLEFWNEQANQLTWQSPWTETLKWERPYSKWFVNGTLNASENCIDIHLKDKKDKTAIVWEAENGNTQTYTYGELSDKVNQLANGLKNTLKIKKGDRVTIYMPLIPEAAIAMLACSRIGAIHSVVFGGFSAPSLAERINDSNSSCIITAQTANRRGNTIPLRDIVTDALTQTSNNISIVTLNKNNDSKTKKEYDFNELIENQPANIAPEPMDSEDPLFILYTSGTTGKPKGILHTTGGYLTHAKYSTKLVFDLEDNDIFWCTADVGWITGHTYLVYGPLANGATIFMYEGTPDYPHQGRFWELIEKHKVTTFYTAPTAIRAFMKQGEDIPKKYNLNSLRLLGTVGEPINPEAWEWYYSHIGQKRCPIVDTWWQTETGGIMLTSLPGYHTMKPGIAGAPLPGIEVSILSESGETLKSSRGLLSITKPWPSMLRGIWGDNQRYEDVYWSKFDTYFAGDGAIIDEENDICVIGRVDDVLNVAGHRIGTMEVESALVDHASVAEAAVIGIKDDIKGEAIGAFVILKNNQQESESLIKELKKHVSNMISPIAKPSLLVCTPDLPKTRSGKIMRRILRQIVDGDDIGDTTTLASPEIIQIIQEKVQLS